MYLFRDGIAGEGDEPEAPVSLVSPVSPPDYPLVPVAEADEHGRFDVSKPLEVGSHLLDRRLLADSADKDLLVGIPRSVF